MKFNPLTALKVSLFLSCASLQAATVIPVQNSSFEANETSDFVKATSSDFITGWTINGGIEYAVLQNLTTPDPDGSNWLNLNADGGAGGGQGVAIFQNVGTIELNTTYDLTVLIGQRPGFAIPQGFSIGLYAGDPEEGVPITLIASLNQSNFSFIPGIANDVIVSSGNITDPTLVGQDLFIQFVRNEQASDAQLLIDNVRLESQSIPETSTALLGMLGAVFLIKRRR